MLEMTSFAPFHGQSQMKSPKKLFPHPGSKAWVEPQESQKGLLEAQKGH